MTMPKFKFEVTQVLRVERTSTIEVDGDSPEDALEALQNGEVDIPSDDALWRAVGSVEDETYKEV